MNFEPIQPKSCQDMALGRGAAGNGRAFQFEKEFYMRRSKLRRLIFMALCCDMGLFAKRLIAPIANVITDSLHIPGGIGTAFSLMFLVIAAALMPQFGSATLMAVVQSGLALAMGRVGSMGLLSPIGYILPGIAIDLVFWLCRSARIPTGYGMVAANALAGVTASLAANVIVFRLSGVALMLYTAVALTCGSICGYLGDSVAQRLIPVIGKEC